MKDVPEKIRSDSLWQNTYQVTSHIYGMIDSIVTNFPDEEWNTASKLRNAANDSMMYTSIAVGNALPEVSSHDWNYARKYLFTLQSMYTFAGKQKFLELDPELIVKIDDILAEIDARLAESKIAAASKRDEELEPWLEKYKLWRKIQE